MPPRGSFSIWCRGAREIGYEAVVGVIFRAGRRSRLRAARLPLSWRGVGTPHLGAPGYMLLGTVRNQEALGRARVAANRNLAVLDGIDNLGR